MHRFAASSLIATLLALAVFAWPRDPGAPAGAPDGAQPAPPTLQVASSDLARAVPPRSRADHWLDPVLDTTLDERRERAEPTEPGSIHARLLWGSSGVAIPGATIRLTHTLLDTVVPTTDDGPDRAHLLAPVATTDHFGDFALPVPRTSRDLYLRIEHPTGFVDFQKVRHVPRRGERAYQGEYLVDDRGTVRGVVVDERGQRLSGVRVRGVDDPLFQQPLVPDEVLEARIAGAEHFDPNGIDRVGSVSRWTRTRDGLLPFPETSTATDGSFELRGLRPGRLHLILQAPDRIGRRTEFVVVPRRTTDVGTLLLRHGRPLLVRVRDRHGEPRKVRVSARLASWRFGPEPRRTDADGLARFFLPEPSGKPTAADGYVQILVERSGRHPWENAGVHEFPKAEVELADPLGKRIQLIDRAGRPVAGARVTTLPRFPGFRKVELGEGSWQLAGLLPRSRALLVVRAAGYAPAVMRGAPPDLMRLVPTFGIRIRVVDELGRGVRGARVRVQFRAKPPHYDDVAGTAWELLREEPTLGRTDAAGELAVDVWDTNFTFIADHPEYGEARSERLPSRDQRIRLQLERPTSVRGFLTDLDQPPTRRYRVLAEHRPFASPRGERHPPRECMTGLDGSYALAKLPPGRWQLTVTDPRAPELGGEAGGARTKRRRLPRRSPWRTRIYAKQTLILAGGQNVYVDLALDPSVVRPVPVLSGVVNVGPEPRADVRVTLRTDLAERWRRRYPKRRVRDDVRTAVAYTDGFGRYRFEEIEHGERATVELALRTHREWLTLDTREVELVDSARLDVDVPVGGLLVGLFDWRGDPLAGRMFRLTRVDADAGSITLVADRTGTIHHDLLPTGRYRIAARTLDDAAPRFWMPEVEVLAGELTLRDLVASFR